ncbi:hypothetical protein O6H91_01G019900 [Diphasiastrum complanatum]|uniref:Uncharacterized protein n=1 Tax=Diphasiastrum complanatum TaxID=34168 RepID=A0ACC2ENR3_DIPCM|nr:hypothetical protein O6H91_01G019900 [Diphasiastrum complanatum]
MKLLTLIAPRRLPTSENSLGAEFEPLLDLMPTVQKTEDSDTSISALTPNLQKVEDSVASSSPPLSPVSAVPGASSFVSTTAALSPISSPNASPSVVLYIQSAPVSPSPKFPVLETDSPAKDTESSRFGNRSFFGSFSKKKPAKIGGSAITPITPKKKHPLISRIKAATEKLKLRRSASFSRTLFDNNPDLKNTSDDLTSSSAPARLESKAFKLLRFASFSDKASSRGQDQPNQCLSPKASAERNSSVSRASSMKKMERKSSNRHLQKSLEAEGSTHKIGMHAKSNDSATLVVGLILIVVLSSLMMGRFTSILCTSCSLLVISNVRMAMLDTKSLKKHLHQREFVDYTSSEYKKKVIMDGLRARDFQGFVHS